MLRIPRLHFDYIDKHGVDEFVEFCEDIVKRERAKADAERAQKMQVDLRNDFSCYKLKRYGAGGNNLELGERLQLKMKECKTTKPFVLDAPLDIRRDDHDSHVKPTELKSAKLSQKEQENRKILD